MKRLLFAFIAILVLSCAKQEMEIGLSSNKDLTPAEAQIEFAEILSKAISQDAELRKFIKEEALKQFDMDYDVFYPYVRDSKVNENNSFRELLLNYTSEERMEEIERVLPLLTIYVPDYSWVGAFSPEKWDTADNEIVVAVKDEEDLKILYNGETVGILDKNQFADFPLLVIKDNERLRVNTYNTKSGEGTYQFISDAFNPAYNVPQTKSWDYHYETVHDIEEPDYYLSASELDSRVIAAYNEYGDTPNRYHRDYIYYGITNEKSSGTYNSYYKEFIYKIKISEPTSGSLYDTTEGEFIDGNFPDSYEKKVEKNKYTIDELRNLDFRIEGKLELRVYAVLGNKNGEIITEEDTYNVAMEDLFDFEKIYVGERDTNVILWRKKYTYSINPNCLVPKWYTLNKPLSIGVGASWNLAETTPYIKLRVEEWDQGETKSRTFTFGVSMTNNISSESTSNNIKTGYGTSTTTTQTLSYTYTYTNNSDVFGEDFIHFTDPIILSKENNKYKVNFYTFGDLEAIIIPKHI